MGFLLTYECEFCGEEVRGPADDPPTLCGCEEPKQDPEDCKGCVYVRYDSHGPFCEDIMGMYIADLLVCNQKKEVI